jgi:hypothetical protein
MLTFEQPLGMSRNLGGIVAVAFFCACFLMVPRPALAQSAQIIYDDALENGWQIDPWDSVTINTGNTSPVHSGSDSISVSASNYGALYLAHAAFNTSAYSNLTFWINGGTGGGQLLQAQALVNGNEQTAVLLSALPANSWQQISLS